MVNEGCTETKKQMKTFILFAALFSGTAFAQTNVIAAKSHASTHTINLNDQDNFGLPIERRVVETVKYLNGTCIVEIYTSNWSEEEKEYDTICDHPFLTPGQTDIKRIKAMYPNKTEFVGFESLEKNQKKELKRIKKENRKKKKSSSLIIFLIGGTLFLTYLFIPKMNPSKS